MKQITEGNLQQTVYVDKSSEFSEMASTFNLMSMSLNNRNFNDKNIHHCISKSLKTEYKISDKTGNFTSSNFQKSTAIIIFIYFKDLEEAIKNIGTNAINHFIQCYNLIKNLISPNKNIMLQKLNYGLNIIITEETLQSSLVKALNLSELIVSKLNSINDLPFSPKCTVKISEIIKPKEILESNEEVTIIGKTYTDFILPSKVQENNDIIVNEQIYEMIKSISNFESLKILLPFLQVFSIFI